jgi:hypothetical protein
VADAEGGGAIVEFVVVDAAENVIIGEGNEDLIGLNLYAL